MQIALPPSKYAQPFQVNGFYRQLLEGLRRLPGVEYAGLVNRLPLGGAAQTGGVAFEGGTPAVSELNNVDWRTASPGYFQAIGIPLVRGRFFTETDTADGQRVGLIDEQIARRVWPNQDPIGKRFRLGNAALGFPWTTVIGVVGHVRHDGLDVDRRPQVYWNYLQRLQPRLVVVIRTVGNPLALASAVQRQVREVDPDQPVYNLRTMEDVVFRSVSQRWFNTVLLGLFAGLAMLLASVGVYGVMSYVVSQRTREIGVRMALGARQTDVLRQVMRQVLTIALAGLGIGLLAALALTRWLSTLLYGISTADPVTLLSAVVILPAVAALASYVPARRAAAVDPMIALRYE
jgi:putative ABC transport system permease protein